MAQMERIQRLAEEVLTFQVSSGHIERWLWDRAKRIARNAEQISKLPELTKKGVSIDLFALLAAAYLSDAGYRLFTQMEGKTGWATLQLQGKQLRENSIQIIKGKEKDPCLEGKTDLICRIIAESENRSTQLLEARVLSDARMLDEIGALGIVHEIRRCILQGKGPGALLEGWDRRIEYRYWEARLKEGFYFPSVRRIAQDRFEAMERYIQQLRKEYFGQDLESFSSNL